MGRKQMSDEEKQRAKELRMSPDGIKRRLETLKEKEAKLLMDLALRECPELESDIVAIMDLINRVEADKELVDKAESAKTVLRDNARQLASKVETVKASFQNAGIDIDLVIPKLQTMKFIYEM